MTKKLLRIFCDFGLRCEVLGLLSACILISSDATRLRFGLSLRFGLRCERPRCQIASDVGRAMQTTKVCTLVLSILSIIDQVGKSVPGLLTGANIWVLAITSCIGAVLSGIVSCASAAIRIQIRIVRCEGAENVKKKTNSAKQRPVFSTTFACW